jgi:FlaA1/EpsC-like NDP-sugar epimerase
MIGRDIELRFSGIRPGEKLYEELSCADETTTPTSHPKIHVWRGSEISSSRIDEMLIQLRTAIGHDRDTIIAALSDCVAEYQPQRTDSPAVIRAAA